MLCFSCQVSFCSSLSISPCRRSVSSAAFARAGSGQCADLPGGGVAVHHRHLHIHQHQIIAARRCRADLFHRHCTVFCRIDPEAVLAQNFLCDLAVQLVVLYQQDVSVLEVGVLFRQKLLRRICQLLAEGAHQSLAQVRQEHRLGTEGGHTGGLCFYFNVSPIVGRQNDDRAAFPDQLADLSHVTSMPFISGISQSMI